MLGGACTPGNGTDRGSAGASTASRPAIDEVIESAARAGVGLQATAALAVDHEPMAGLLFGYGGIATEHIEEAMERLRASFDSV